MSRHSDLGLSVEQWCSLVERGMNVPLTTPIMGYSMYPVVRYGVDPVTIVPLMREPVEGDIVLFRRRDGMLVIHRVYQVMEDMVQTWGDNCRGKDRPVSRQDVLGLVVSVHRDGQEIALDTPEQRQRGVRWMHHPLRTLYFLRRRLRAVGGRLIRRVWPGFHRKRS